MIEIVQGNALNIPLPARSVQCVVTSPPYWGLRDYGSTGQLGLETTPEEYVANMVAVFRDVWRVLRDDGVLWLNLGDSYAHSGRGEGGNGIHSTKQTTNRGAYFDNHALDRRSVVNSGLKPKDLVGIPWRVAFALQADGWYLRSDIIWHKPNPMPESVQDRPTKSHEYLFLLSKSERYYYDNDAIKEPGIYSVDERKGRARDEHKSALSKERNGIRPQVDKQRGHQRRHDGFNEKWDAMSKEEQCSLMRNKRDVWTVATVPYPGSHFATFPVALVEPCILAGSRPGDLVMDPFSGTATVGEVCIEHQRSFIGIELKRDYIWLAHDRLHCTQIGMVF